MRLVMETLHRFAVFENKILQLALTRLIAYGAIKGMVHQEKLQQPLPGLLNLFAIGIDFPTVLDLGYAGRHELGSTFDFHQTHPTDARRFQIWMIQKAGISTPTLAAAFNIVVPAGTSISMPSITTLGISGTS